MLKDILMLAAANNFNAVNTAINTVTGGCPSCTAQ